MSKELEYKLVYAETNVLFVGSLEEVTHLQKQFETVANKIVWEKEGDVIHKILEEYAAAAREKNKILMSDNSGDYEDEEHQDYSLELRVLQENLSQEDFNTFAHMRELQLIQDKDEDIAANIWGYFEDYSVVDNKGKVIIKGNPNPYHFHY